MSDLLKFKTPTPSSPATIEPIPLTRKEKQMWQILASQETSATVLAEEFGVTHQTIRNVKLVKTKGAKEVRDMLEDWGQEFYTWEPAKRFTDAEVKAIRASTKASHIIAKAYKCSPSTIRMIKSGQSYRDA